MDSRRKGQGPTEGLVAGASFQGLESARRGLEAALCLAVKGHPDFPPRERPAVIKSKPLLPHPL